MKSFLTSALAHKYGAMELDAFRKIWPHDWLVWEPGIWMAPTSSTLKLPSMGDLPAPMAPGEALALALVPKNDGSPLKVGRAAECDAVISDGTLSSVHLLLTRDAKGVWSVRDAGSRNGTRLDGRALAAGVSAALYSGAKVVAAQVAFTFYDSAGLLQRLKGP